jgi:hypothetical protein
MRSAPFEPVDAPPDAAVMMAFPLLVPAMKFTTARPLMSVVASEGSSRPSVVVKLMWVPLCGGVPAASSTCAIICVLPFAESADVVAVSVIVDPVGASNGTLSHAPATKAKAIQAANIKGLGRYDVNIKTLNILFP